MHDEEARVDTMGTGSDSPTALENEPTPAVAGANDVTFTQYLRPHGRPRQVWIERPPAVVAQAARVRAAGFHFDIEELMDGTVSMTVESNRPNDDEGPLSIELCPNGPQVPATVDRLIATAAERLGV